MDQQKIGAFISELRKDRKLTQEQLGEKLGVSQRSISRWETGRNMPDISLLKPLSSELGITVSELIEGERQDNPVKIDDESVDNIIEYTVRLRKNNIVFWKDVNFITTVLIILAVVLLGAGVAIQHLTIPLLVLGILVVVFAVRFLFCKCPGCGKTLPYSMKKITICPHCGLKLDRGEDCFSDYSVCSFCIWSILGTRFVYYFNVIAYCIFSA